MRQISPDATEIRSGLKQVMVDLHGLSVASSQASVGRHINLAQQTDVSLLRIVTGRGNHINRRGERGTLYRELPNWLSEEHKSKINSVKAGNGFYEISIKSAPQKSQFYSEIEKCGEQWLCDHKEKIIQAANSNNHEAQYFLGHCYQYGLGVDRDDKTAVQWYMKAVAGKDYHAQYALGGCYWQGRGVRQDDQKAIKLFHDAAEQNFSWALHLLGDIYCYGYGITVDPKLASIYYKKAVDAGLDIAKRKLAHLYFAGDGIDKNEPEAFRLYKEAADNGDAHSAYNTAFCYLEGHGTQRNPAMAFKYAKQGSDGNDPDAQFLVATFYFQGWGTDQNTELALKYLKLSADQNFKHALLHLALYYSAKDETNDESIALFIKAAKAGQIIAQAIVLNEFDKSMLSQQELDEISTNFWKQEDDELLTISYERFKILVLDTYVTRKDLTKKQREKILRLLKELAKQNFSQAFMHLADLYLKGNIVNKDLKKTEYYWQQGAKIGCSNCLYNLGYYFEEGMGGSIDYQQAFNYYARAAEKGNANSYNQLALLYKLGQGTKKDIQQAIFHFHQALYLDSKENRFNQKQGVFYLPAYRNAAYNLASIYWHGDPTGEIIKDKNQAIKWFIIAANDGDEESQRILNQLQISYNQQNTYQQNHLASFWKPVVEEKSIKNKEDQLNLLNKISGKLSIKSNWSITRDDKAWCYITEVEQLTVSTETIKPITVRMTKDQRYILLLENISKIDLSQLLDSLKSYSSKKLSVN